MAEFTPTFWGTCWSCGKATDDYTGIRSRPKKGDAIVCAYCGELSIAEPPSYRKPTPEEIEQFQADPKRWRVLQEMQKYIRRNGVCWSCQRPIKLHACTSGAPHQPSRGDVGVCTNCGAVGIFDPPPRLRPLTPAEAQELQGDPEMSATVRSLVAAARGGKP